MQIQRISYLLPLVAALLLCGCGDRTTATTGMLHKVSSKHPVAEISDRIATAAKKHDFGVVTTHNMREMMKKKGVEFERDVFVVEVCNAYYAKTVLNEDVSISTALPCRISVYREGDETILATMAPTLMIDMFGRESLRETAATVQKILYDIMAEAAK